jgi:hypothetical protein
MMRFLAPSLPCAQLRKRKCAWFARTATHWNNFTSSIKVHKKAQKELCLATYDEIPGSFLALRTTLKAKCTWFARTATHWNNFTSSFKATKKAQKKLCRATYDEVPGSFLALRTT